MFLFRGNGKGGYLDGLQLVGPNDQPLQIDNATSVSLYDWDKDGKPDLFVGTISGPVWYVPNKGWGKVGVPVKLSGGETAMDAPDGGPCAADWDGDGTVDLFLGAESGRLLYYHGVKGGDHPTFSDPVEVLSALGTDDQDPKRALPGKDLDWDLKRPLVRPKPSVCDWNHDGKLDLLVGDFCLLEGPLKDLPPDKAKLFHDLREEQDKGKAKSAAINEEIRKKTYAELGWKPDHVPTNDELEKYNSVYTRLYQANAEAVALDKRLVDVFEQLTPLMPDTGYHGFVWLFLHK